MSTVAIAKAIVRNGHSYIPDAYKFHLGMFEEINDLIPFECKLEQDYFRKGDWVITCPEIMEGIHNAFWAGQGCDSSVEVGNPTQWMDAWQHERNPTWRK